MQSKKDHENENEKRQICREYERKYKHAQGGNIIHLPRALHKTKRRGRERESSTLCIFLSPPTTLPSPHLSKLLYPHVTPCRKRILVIMPFFFVFFLKVCVRGGIGGITIDAEINVVFSPCWYCFPVFLFFISDEIFSHFCRQEG
ncbi:hypothetical protein F5H01DRAFT_335610 [Linnemannia elongata]|nr:hypothetical protein F5H01DRAFT_335610 [Linnemannia elongata]